MKSEIKGRARHSVRAVVCLAQNGAHGVTRPTFLRVNFGNHSNFVKIVLWCNRPAATGKYRV